MLWKAWRRCAGKGTEYAPFGVPVVWDWLVRRTAPYPVRQKRVPLCPDDRNKEKLDGSRKRR